MQGELQLLRLRARALDIPWVVGCRQDGKKKKKREDSRVKWVSEGEV